MRAALSSSLRFGRPGRLAVLSVALTGCGGGSAVPGEPARPLGEPPVPVGVTLRVSVDAALFAAGTSLRVQVWNGDQLAAVERNGRCATAFDPATGTESIRCPEGTTYQPVKPEEAAFPVSEIAGSVEVSTTHVRVGDKFRILLSAKSRDGCNTTSADHVGTAESASVVLGSLEWSTTARGCVGGLDE
jgi:hypothetical protein